MLVYILLAALVGLWLVEVLRRIPRLSNLSNKYVLITGCDSGFGRQLAYRLDQQGMHVIATCLTEKSAKNLMSTTTERLSAFILDVTDNSSVQRALSTTQEILSHSGEGLWGLVNNAGITGNLGQMDWWNREDYRKIIDVNLLGLIDVTNVFTPLLKGAKGRIVNVASILGRLALPDGGYSISKFGVECFSDEIRVMLKPFGVSVSIIEPSFFKTSIINMEFMANKLKTKWKDLSPETRKEYGEDYLDKYTSFVAKKLDFFSSNNTYKVIDAMEHALTAKYPKKRYSVGYDAKLLWIPLSYFPSCITDFIIKTELLFNPNAAENKQE